MRRVLFYAFCIGFVALVAIGIRWFFHSASAEFGYGVGVGFGFAVLLFFINERVDITNGKRDPETGVKWENMPIARLRAALARLQAG